MGINLFTILALAGSLPTVFIAGDSTANNTNHKGWGDPVTKYFDLTRINVANRARAGRSARTFVDEGLWDKLIADVKPGDYVLIQFGHNDGGPPDKDKARGDLPGIGDESKDVTMPDGKQLTVHTYGWYIRKFVEETKAKDAHPVVLSLTVRNIWKDGKVERGSGHFGEWSREVAKAEGVPFEDATNIIADAYEKMGQEKVTTLFPEDHTHTSPEGAEIVASLIVEGLRQMHSPLADFLVARR
jgi:rhamnogalacturonan acetylesterase